MKLDATKMKDWEIAEAAEENMKPFADLAAEMGLQKEEIIPVGKRVGKIDFIKAMHRLKLRHLSVLPEGGLDIELVAAAQGRLGNRTRRQPLEVLRGPEQNVA